MDYLLHHLKGTLGTLGALRLKLKKKKIIWGGKKKINRKRDVNGIDIGYRLPRHHFIFLHDSVAAFYMEWFNWALYTLRTKKKKKKKIPKRTKGQHFTAKVKLGKRNIFSNIPRISQHSV